jgi:hypothetical protein
MYSCGVRSLCCSSCVGLEEEDDCILYLLTAAIPIFPLALAAVDVEGFPFTLRLAFKASSMSVVSSGSSSCSLTVTFCPLDFASISFSNSSETCSGGYSYLHSNTSPPTPGGFGLHTEVERSGGETNPQEVIISGGGGGIGYPAAGGEGNVGGFGHRTVCDPFGCQSVGGSGQHEKGPGGNSDR